METTGHNTIFKLTYRPDLQAISTHATEDQVGMALAVRCCQAACCLQTGNGRF